MSGFWVVRVDRSSGEASTEWMDDKDAAWQAALDRETPEAYTTVVRQTTVARQR